SVNHLCPFVWGSGARALCSTEPARRARSANSRSYGFGEVLTLMSVFSSLVCPGGFTTVVFVSFFSDGGFMTVVLLSFFSAGGLTVVVFCSQAPNKPNANRAKNIFSYHLNRISVRNSSPRFPQYL